MQSSCHESAERMYHLQYFPKVSATGESTRRYRIKFVIFCSYFVHSFVHKSTISPSPPLQSHQCYVILEIRALQSLLLLFQTWDPEERTHHDEA